MADIEFYGRGITRLVCPMPRFASVNAWILGDGDERLVVDTGMPGQDTRDLWQKATDQHLLDGVSALVCTHMHRDHTGQAPTLLKRHGMPLYMSELEHRDITAASSADEEVRRQNLKHFLFATGLPAETAERIAPIDYSMLAPFPAAAKSLEDGQFVRLGGRQWRVLIGGGHSRAGVCLLAEDNSVFVSGDQVLTGSGPHISVWNETPEADPLAAFFAFLTRLDGTPDTTLVLPGHGAPFSGLAAHAKALRAAHQARLDSVLDAVHKAMTIAELAQHAFSGRAARQFLELLPGMTLSLANHLWHSGKVSRRHRDDGVLLFERR